MVGLGGVDGDRECDATHGDWRSGTMIGEGSDQPDVADLRRRIAAVEAGEPQVGSLRNRGQAGSVNRIEVRCATAA